MKFSDLPSLWALRPSFLKGSYPIPWRKTWCREAKNNVNRWSCWGPPPSVTIRSIPFGPFIFLWGHLWFIEPKHKKVWFNLSLRVFSPRLLSVNLWSNLLRSSLINLSLRVFSPRLLSVNLWSNLLCSSLINLSCCRSITHNPGNRLFFCPHKLYFWTWVQVLLFSKTDTHSLGHSMGRAPDESMCAEQYEGIVNGHLTETRAVKGEGG
jgi:hypothetical protein